MAVLRRTYVSALTDSGAVALGSNKHDLSPYTRLKKQGEVCREEGAGVLPANTGGNWSKVKTSVILTSQVRVERCLNGSWTHSRVQWSVWSVSTTCAFRLSWGMLEEGLVLGHMGSSLFLAGFPEHPALIGWQCFPRASWFRGLHSMAKLPDLIRRLLGGEGRCWFSFSLMWSWKEKGGKVRTAACPQLGSPTARALWKPLAFGHWREVFHQENSARVLRYQQHWLVPGGQDDDTDCFLLLVVTPGSRVTKITCNYKCILLINDLCCMLGILRDNFPFHFLEQHPVGCFVACLPLLYMGCACFSGFCPK